MKISIIMFSVIISFFILFLFHTLHKLNKKANIEMSNEYFIITIPKIVLLIGIVIDLMSLIIIFAFTHFSSELPHISFYIIFGLFLLLGIYLIVKSLNFKVIVNGKKITVFSIFSKSYIFTFDDIVSVVHQVKKNQLKSERLIVKTSFGQRIVLESTEVSYKRFLNKIKKEVKKEFLFGFE